MQFYNPNVIGKQATPEGHTGPNASLRLPFYSFGRWFANGQQLTFLTGELIQRRSSKRMGLIKPDTFRKDASSCNGAPTSL